MIQEAGLVNVIKTILVILAVYYGLKFLAKYLFPFLLKRFINKQQEKFYGQTGNQFNQNKSTDDSREGEVKITSRPSHQNKTDDLGEYVDYEELSDDKKDR